VVESGFRGRADPTKERPMTRKSLGRFRFGLSLRIQDAPICHNLPNVRTPPR